MMGEFSVTRNKNVDECFAGFGFLMVCSVCGFARSCNEMILSVCEDQCAACNVRLLNIAHSGSHCDLHRVCLFNVRDSTAVLSCAKCDAEPKVSSLAPRRDGAIFFVFK
jgi:hypothetical protein